MSQFPPQTTIPVTATMPMLDGAVVHERRIVGRPGETLREILARLTFHPDYAAVYVVAPSGAVYGPIPPAWWDHVRPRAERTIIVQVLPHGGSAASSSDANSKDRLAANAGVIIAALLLSWFVRAPYGALLGMVVSIGGGLLVNALLPVIPNTMSKVTGQLTRDREPDSLSITGSQNKMNRYGPIACVYGQSQRWPAWGPA